MYVHFINKYDNRIHYLSLKINYIEKIEKRLELSLFIEIKINNTKLHQNGSRNTLT